MADIDGFPFILRGADGCSSLSYQWSIVYNYSVQMANLWYDARDEWNFLFHEYSEVQSLQEDHYWVFLFFGFWISVVLR